MAKAERQGQELEMVDRVDQDLEFQSAFALYQYFYAPQV
jgi:hypothetical protein